MEKLKEPFYAWECITLVTKKRTLDLVIQENIVDTNGNNKKDVYFNTNDYDNIFALINAIQTLANTQRSEDRQLPPVPISAIKLMIVKMKISYEALLKGKTIHELFYVAIENTLEKLFS